MAEILIKANADVNKATMVRVEKVEREELKLALFSLLSSSLPLSVSLSPQDGATPMYIAACRNSKEVLEILVRAGADISRAFRVR